jgi:uncharacterized RDD family membrane protein YckC
VSNYPSGGGSYSYSYPVAPTNTGSLQPLNLAVNGPPDQRGKISKGDGTYYQCANWLWRVLSALIDYTPVFILVAFALPLGDWLDQKLGTMGMADLLAWTVIIVIVGFNNVFLQGMTGQSIGKKALGMQLVRAITTTDGRELLVRPGVLLTLVRQLCHVVDAAVFYLGFLAPLWTRRYQTFSDLMFGIAVLKEPGGELGLPFAPPGSRPGRL